MMAADTERQQGLTGQRDRSKPLHSALHNAMSNSKQEPGQRLPQLASSLNGMESAEGFFLVRCSKATVLFVWRAVSGYQPAVIERSKGALCKPVRDSVTPDCYVTQ